MKHALAISFLLLLFLPALTCASTLQAVVVEVNDGNTLIVVNTNRRMKIKLKAAAAPETGQPLADVARQHLADLVLGKEIAVDISVIGTDGMFVGKVYQNGMDVGQQMIRDGVAWYDPAYESELNDTERQLYSLSEQAARQERRGIWLAANPTPPWKFGKNEATETHAQEAGQGSVSARAATEMMGSHAASSNLRSKRVGSPTAWTKIAPAKGGVSIMFPGVPVEFAQEYYYNSTAAVTLHIYHVENRGLGYNLVRIDNLPQSLMQADAKEDFFTRLPENVLQSAEKGAVQDATLARERKIYLHNYSGREYQFDARYLSCTMKVFAIRRSYFIVVVGGLKAAMIADQAKVNRFLSSFTLR